MSSTGKGVLEKGITHRRTRRRPRSVHGELVHVLGRVLDAVLLEHDPRGQLHELVGGLLVGVLGGLPGHRVPGRLRPEAEGADVEGILIHDPLAAGDLGHAEVDDGAVAGALLGHLLADGLGRLVEDGQDALRRGLQLVVVAAPIGLSALAAERDVQVADELERPGFVVLDLVDEVPLLSGHVMSPPI